MSSSTDDVEVTELPAEHRFVARRGDAEAELVYQTDGDRMLIVHTEVPDALSGHGVAGLLVSAAVDRAAADGLTVVPSCPFTRGFLRRNPDQATRVTIDWSPPSTVTKPDAGSVTTREDALDEQEVESFPASDPHSDWAGPS